MRRFQFRLAAVLRHRETVEELRERDFAQVQQNVQSIEARLRELQQEFRSIVLSRPGGCVGVPFDVGSIYDRERYLQVVQSAIERQKRALETAQILLEEKRQELIAARQAREALSRLYEREWQAHVHLCNKMEQDALDEIATRRHTRLRPAIQEYREAA
ncbi:MAG: flagellar export protein FliJ [Chloroherpetonaceae bacterium]|nr:flagellar export protein FliJ [Chthonomonadaceae bacterium]MDW8208024.1 flagellar export protein FliJ [Chloroherpetonaceae bacterium]